MYVLDTTTKTLIVNLTAAVATSNPEFTACYADTSANTVVEGSSEGAVNGTTDVTIVAAPAASTRRIVKYITVYNGDTAAVTFNLKYNSNGTQRQIAKVTLQSGETWYGD
jgi:hypothetical protein